MLVGVVLVGPRLLYPPLTDRELDRQGVTGGKDRIELKREQGQLQNDARTTLLQALAGGALLLGAYFTWRQVQTGRQQVHLAEQGQITERFTRAIDQLGSDHLDVRLGGIYALERIARDSPGDRATIGEVLTAYVRGHAPWPPRLPDQPPVEAAIDAVTFLRLRAPDVQAALTVLGRGRFADPDPDAPALDLSDTDLRRAYLRGADLRRARLYAADLRRAHFEDTDLRGATLTRAYLQEAHLPGASLQDATLYRTDLRDADLTGAILAGADLRHANLQGTKLDGADLRGARLEGTGPPGR
ncbi:MAG TPA: pentapeptide repeat-containing protein [Actinomycetes bacterium]